MGAQENLNPHQFHIEKKNGEVVDQEYSPHMAQQHWDELVDNPHNDIAYARWSKPGKRGPVVKGTFGSPSEDKPKSESGATGRQQDHEAEIRIAMERRHQDLLESRRDRRRFG